MSGLGQSGIRDKVQTYFKAQLDQHLDWLDPRGLSKNALTDAREEMLDHESFLEMETELYSDIPTLTQASLCSLLIFDEKEIREVETQVALPM